MQIIWVGTSVIFIFVLLMLIKRRILSERYSLLWLLFGMVMLIITIKPSVLDLLASVFNIYYAPALLFLVGILFCITLILYLTAIVSKLSDKLTTLTQEVGILQLELDKLKEKDILIDNEKTDRLS